MSSDQPVSAPPTAPEALAFTPEPLTESLLPLAGRDSLDDAATGFGVRTVAPSDRAKIEKGRIEQGKTAPESALSVPGLPASVPIEEVNVAHVLPSMDSIDVFLAPSESAAVGWTLPRIDEFAQPRVFRVTGVEGAYLRVQVPVRPNESEGWIKRSDVELGVVNHRVLIDLSERSVIVWEGDAVVMDTTGSIGKPDTPTPTGSFYIRSAFAWNAESVYGPWVIPLSAYSESIDQINGGDAVVAIHGTQRADLIGAAVSLGCVRLENETITELAALVPAGTPVEIVP